MNTDETSLMLPYKVNIILAVVLPVTIFSPAIVAIAPSWEGCSALPKQNLIWDYLIREITSKTNPWAGWRRHCWSPFSLLELSKPGTGLMCRRRTCWRYFSWENKNKPWHETVIVKENVIDWKHPQGFYKSRTTTNKFSPHIMFPSFPPQTTQLWALIKRMPSPQRLSPKWVWSLPFSNG